MRPAVSVAYSATSSATVSPMRRKTTSACSWLISSGSKPMRPTRSSPSAPSVRSPLCGPLPVTTVPSTRTAAVAAAIPFTSSANGRRTSSWPTPGSRLRSHSVVISATRTADSRKCAATVQGFSPVSTVMPPSAACTGMPRKPRTASRRRSRRGDRHTTTTVATATAASTKVSSRLPNSITPCPASSDVATKLSSVQRGHVGQPRPEPVRRTAPPVTTMSPLATALARATREIVREEKEAGRTGTTRC